MSKPIFRDLRKCVLLQHLVGGAFKARDLLNREEITGQMNGKQRMNYFNLPIGEAIYVKYSEYSKEHPHRLVTDFDFKMNQTLFLEKCNLDQTLKGGCRK